MAFFERFSTEPGPNWKVIVRVTSTIEVVVFGGDEARARREAELAIDAEETDIVEILKIEKV